MALPHVAGHEDHLPAGHAFTGPAPGCRHRAGDRLGQALRPLTFRPSHGFAAILAPVIRVRFAPSPTGSLHLGNALTAVANRSFGDWLLLRIDDTDPTRTVQGGAEEIERDLEWLDVGWDDGPVRQSERADVHRAAAARLADIHEDDGALRWRGATLVRADGTATYQLASVVDDTEFGSRTWCAVPIIVRTSCCTAR